MSNNSPRVGIIMGSKSDWPTLEHTAKTLSEFGIPWEAKVVSAHRTPQLLYSYAETAAERGIQCIIAGAGGAAHLPGMAAAITTCIIRSSNVLSDWRRRTRREAKSIS